MMRLRITLLDLVFLAAVTLAALMVAMSPVIVVAAPQAASVPTPKFEVASIKRNVSGGPDRYIRPSGGRLSIANMTLKNLITIAYQIRDFQIYGGPSWMTSESYNIEAKSEGAATPKQMEGPMLQALLEDRFQLRVRHDTEELPIYVLTVPKLNQPLLTLSFSNLLTKLQYKIYLNSPIQMLFQVSSLRYSIECLCQLQVSMPLLPLNLI